MTEVAGRLDELLRENQLLREELTRLATELTRSRSIGEIGRAHV